MDLFDRLQDELLTHIICFLPTKYAVSTSVLSRRWKLLWCYADKLVFDDSISFHGLREDVGYYGLDETDRVLPFINFVDRVVDLNKASHVEKFLLKMYPSHGTLKRLQYWLDSIVRKTCAKEIQVHLNMPICWDTVSFNLENFSSASLQVLKLYFGNYHPLRVCYNSSRSVSLPNLKILHLWMDGIQYKFWLFKYLFRASPQLEEACFGGNLYGKISKLFCNIYAPSLKRLRMKFLTVESSHKFLINAPMLEELVILDESAFQHYVVKSNYLVNAKLDIGSPHVRKFQELHIHIHRVCKLLCRVSNVKFLNLRAHTMDALSICCNSVHSNLPRFPALCHLKLCFLNYSSWDVISKLLECAPSLEVLVVSKDFKDKDVQFRKDSVWIQPSSVPICLSSSLRQVEVWDCESHQVEFNLINYLLKHGDVLSTFLVELLPAGSRNDLRFKEKLMLIPRASKTCELKVSTYPHCSQHSGSSIDEENHHLATLHRRMPPQKMCFEDLRVCTDYFSDEHLIIRTENCKVYRGKLHQSSPCNSPVRDVVVKKCVIRAKSPYNKYKESSLCSFRGELKLLEHPNFKYHPHFMSLLGYCAEDNNERLGVVYDMKPLDCLENLIPEDSFKWLQRIKVALVVACILEYMHKKHGDFPSITPILSPSSVILDEDYMPALFNFEQRPKHFREADQHSVDVHRYGQTLLGLISKRVHRCPNARSHTSECRTMFCWGDMQAEDRYVSSSLCKSQIPLVHKNLMDDSAYDVVDGLKITRLAIRCIASPQRRPNLHAIIKYLCKLRVVRENWDIFGCDNILGDHLNVGVSFRL